MQPPLEPPTLGDGAGIGPRLCGDDPDHGSDDDRRRERTHARHNGFTRAYVAGHGDQDDEVPAAEVKAIFFMLGPGEKLEPAGGARIRVIFLDGRTIEGTRDSGDAPKGFFLVPSDAARTSTRRVFVAREATKAVHTFRSCGIVG